MWRQYLLSPPPHHPYIARAESRPGQATISIAWRALLSIVKYTISRFHLPTVAFFPSQPQATASLGISSQWHAKMGRRCSWRLMRRTFCAIKDRTGRHVPLGVGRGPLLAWPWRVSCTMAWRQSSLVDASQPYAALAILLYSAGLTYASAVWAHMPIRSFLKGHPLDRRWSRRRHRRRACLPCPCLSGEEGLCNPAILGVCARVNSCVARLDHGQGDVLPEEQIAPHVSRGYGARVLIQAVKPDGHPASLHILCEPRLGLLCIRLAGATKVANFWGVNPGEADIDSLVL